MSFDVSTWKKNVHEHLQEWKARLGRTGITSLYASLSAASLWPVVQAAQGGQFMPAIMALGSVAGGLGGNLLAEQVQRWKGKPDDEDENQLVSNIPT